MTDWHVHDLLDLGFAKLDGETSALLVQGKVGNEAYDETPMVCALGVTAMPYPATEEGACEAVLCMGLPGTDGYIIGARDLRSANVVGNLKPGDTCVHSNGPNKSARITMKDEERLIGIIVTTKGGKNVVIIVDGEKEKVIMHAAGYQFQMGKQDGMVMKDKWGSPAGIQIKDGVVAITGKVVLGGRTPVAPVMGQNPLALAVPTPILGVFYGR